MTTMIDKLFDRAIVQPNGCWEFNGERNHKGYGHIKYEGIHTSVHRVAYILCVNPEHLRLGTHTENMAERNSKNRQARPQGIKCGAARLDESDVKIIRQELAQGISQRRLAQKFNVSQTAIASISTGRTWRHLL